MPIVQTINEQQFVEAFRTWETYRYNFTYEGLRALYEHLEEVSECMDNKTIELDVIAICCDYTEFENFKDFQESFSDTDIKHIFGGSKDCLDYWTSIVLPECWVGKDSDNTEEVKHLPFIIHNF